VATNVTEMGSMVNVKLVNTTHENP